jgi:hypothetical protein
MSEKEKKKDDSEEWTKEDEEDWQENVVPKLDDLKKSKKRLDKGIREFGKVIERIKDDNVEAEEQRLEDKKLKQERVEKATEKQNLVAEVKFTKDLLLKKTELPEDLDQRVKQLNEVNKQSLKFLRERETLITGIDPEPLFLGKSEDLKEDVYELYVKCKQCGKVFRTFKNSEFCNSVCRYNWVKEHMPDSPQIQEIFAERENESWDWKPIGNRTEENLGNFTIYKRVFKKGETKNE